jgi:hypothetical protein
MTAEELLRRSAVALEVNAPFTEAVVRMRDGSRLCFCHRVGERWARAVSQEEAGGGNALAEQVLSAISLFRLNAKHLEVWFSDGSRWEAPFGKPKQEP